jgi:tetratricopeptide (TPR) repeat protein
MSWSTKQQRRSRLTWLIAAAAAAFLFLGSLATNLIATDIYETIKPYRFWVWLVCIVAFVVTVVAAVNQHRHVSASAEDEAGAPADPPAASDGEKAREVFVYRARDKASALHQLPPPPRDFTGRKAELQELRTSLEQGGVTISGLRGLGGIGKTTLALKLAEELKPRYPDAQFYLDLRGANPKEGPGPKPLSVAEALSHVVRAYHPTAKLPDSEAELRALYLSVLDGQRALLLMDNAAGREQVEPLIPPDGCILLVTSRQHFTLPGLVAKDLDTLAPDEARALLLKIAPRIGKQADTIATLCGRLPLALRLAASALAERPNLSAADYVRRLTVEQKRLELVEASLSLSYDLLTPELQKLWRTLAVFPDTFDAAAAAAVWEKDVDAAQDTLGELIKYSLVEWSDETARHRLHDLARLFADARMSKEERGATQTRHATYYLNVLRESDRLYKQGGEAIKSGLALFDLEWRNIQSGQSWAEKQSSESDTAASLCDDYPDAGAYLLVLRRHPREQIYWREAALAVARRLKNRVAEGAHLGNLGNAYYFLGERRRAVEFHEQALDISREIGDRHAEGAHLSNLGNAYVDLGEMRRGIEFYGQALAIARAIGERRGEGNALCNLGNAYYFLGEPQRTIEYSEQSLAVFRELGDRLGESAALGNLGNAYGNLDESQRAIEFYKQQLVITRDIGDLPGEGSALYNTGVQLNKLGDRARAISHAEAALEIFEQIESPHAKTVRATIAKWRGQE